jgi:hypothetical protein
MCQNITPSDLLLYNLRTICDRMKLSERNIELTNTFELQTKDTTDQTMK